MKKHLFYIHKHITAMLCCVTTVLIKKYSNNLREIAVAYDKINYLIYQLLGTPRNRVTCTFYLPRIINPPVLCQLHVLRPCMSIKRKKKFPFSACSLITFTGFILFMNLFTRENIICFLLRRRLPISQSNV